MIRSWSIVDILRDHARRRPDHLALVVLSDGETEQARLTYAQLDARVRTVAARMQREGLAGQRVLLMLDTSVDYVVGFLACLYAGSIAVPLSPPTRASHRERVDQVLVDCTPSAAVVHEGDVGGDGYQDCRLWTIGRLAESDHEWTPPEIAPDGLAYLQYTSGSTSNAKGVMVTHENLTHQIRMFSAGLGLSEDDTVVSWLPLFHDFGLVAGLMMPLMLGGSTVKMPPPMFVQRPSRWLAAISRYRGTASFGPNFPLDLCVERITEAEKSTLDLSSWRVLGLGAEPIRWGTLRRFADAFAGCGFSARSLRTVYGMAESTLVVTVSPPQDGGPTAIDIDAAEFAEGRLRQLTGDASGSQWQKLLGNGSMLGDTELLIVDPATREPQPEGAEGEIWMRGKTVCPGYWERPDDNAETFGAYLADGRGPFLRSGDLGAMVSGEMYMTGRLKDLIIIRGRNVHPQDIELTSAHAHPALKRGVCVAFSVDRDGEERLVVAHELKRDEDGGHNPAEVVRAIRGAVAEEHEVAVDTVVLLRPGTMPMTTSGKLRRRYCRQLFLRGELTGEHVSGPTEPAAAVERDSVVEWLRARVSALTGLTVNDVGVDVTFGAFGLDSVTQTAMTGDLAAELGRQIDPTLLYSHPTIAKFAAALAATESRDTPDPVTVPVETHEPVAVVGMACEFPGAPTLEQFWDLLVEGRDAVAETPADRWPMTGHGGFLADVAGFDARFFGISADEAATMDPQQRLLLTNAWRALEDAGIPVESVAGTPAGVFVGICGTDYHQLQTRDAADPVAYTGTGTALSIAANRLSYFFDLTGPSIAVDTACSSSLVAAHQAVLSLRRGECDVALVGGVNLLLDSDLTSAFVKAGMLSPDGRCHTFDAAANGYVRGEGCGVLVLKRLEDARRDNDRVRAVIAGSAVNQDGRANTLTAPNGLAQQKVIRQALAAAGMSPEQVGHVEAHGTGTALGDPIEMAGITEVYGPGGSEPVFVGSVKTNVGHLEAAAGIAGLIKTVLAVERGVVPAHLHLTELNPLISLDGTRCRIPTETLSWKHGTRRVGGVSSFGFGGTNAHVIVSEAPEGVTPSAAEDGGWRLLPLSARSDWALGELVDDTADLLEDTDGPPFAAVTRAAARRRSHLGHRMTVVARSAGEAADLLRAERRGERSGLVATGTARHGGPGPTAFLFPGQGFQRLGMASPFHARHAAFRDAAEQCDAVARAELGVSLLPSVAGTPGDLVDLEQTRFGQPAMFLVQYALAQTWQSYGVRPDLVLGHSLGEYAAACVAGALTVADAMRLVLLRARLMQETPPGAMYAVHSERAAELLGELDLTGDMVVAAINSPKDFTISGTETAAEQVAALCLRQGARVSRLAVTRAFHSSLMDTVATDLARAAAPIAHQAPRIPLVTNLTGDMLGDKPLDAEHWALHLRQPVRFADGVRTLEAQGVRCVVELGPEPVLTPLAQRELPNATWLTSGHRGDGDDRQLLAGLGRWYVDGGTVDFTELDPTDPAPAPVTLPGHPLRPVRHWYRAGVRRNADPGATGHPLVGTHADLAEAAKDHYVGVLEAGQPWFVDQHRLFDVPVLPGSAMIEWALGAVRAGAGGGTSWLLEDVRFTSFLPLPDNRSVPTQAVVDGNSVTCFAKDEDTRWKERVRVGTVRAGETLEPGRTSGEPGADNVELPVSALYERFADSGVGYGPAFRAVRSLRRGDREAVGHIEVTERGPGDEEYLLHPVVLDACFHVAAALVEADGQVLVPVSVDRLQVTGALPAEATCHAWLVGERTLDLRVTAGDGTVVADLRGLALQPVDEQAVVPNPPLRALVTEWVPVEDELRSLDLAGETWLVLGPDPASTERRIAELDEAGVTPIGAVVTDPAELDTVVDKLRPDLATLTGIVVDAGPGGDGPGDLAGLAQGTTLPLGRLLAAEATARPAVVVCSQNAAAVAGSTPNPAQAATTALTRTLIAEYPTLHVVQVDVDSQDGVPLPVTEILSRSRAQEGSGHLAVRDGRWYRAELRSERLQSRDVTLRPDASYLITGGWGALGRVAAARLVALGARHLVLAGRTPPDDQAAWLTELRGTGAEISLRAVDLGNDDAVRELVAAVPNLRGVVHAAGVTDDGLLADLDWSRFQQVLAPKADGAWSLHRHTAGQPLDFFVLYSSLAALIGNPGQANYALANAFLDGLAQARRHAGLPATSINWGPWSEGGLATSPGVLAELGRTGIRGISDSQGAAALSCALADQYTQVGLATVDWARYVAATGRTDTLLTDLAPVEPATTHTVPAAEIRELAVVDPPAAERQLTQLLLVETSVLLGLSPSQREELRPTFSEVAFNTLGLDSLMAVRLRNWLFDYLAVDLPNAVFFDVGTVSDVARTIRERVTTQAVLGTEDSDSTADVEVFRI